MKPVRKIVAKPKILALLEEIQRERETPNPELLAKQARLLAILQQRRQVAS